MKNKTWNLLALAFCLLFIFPSMVLIAEDENTQTGKDEYLAFEFFFSATAQRQYEMLEGQRENKNFFDTTQAILDYRFEDFSLFIDWSMIDDERYDPSEVYMLGRYFYINDAYVDYETEHFSFKTGRSTQKDVIDSPYSLFVSSEPIPAVQMEAKYKGDFFFYTNRWVNLNHNSQNTYFGTAEDSPFWDYSVDIGTVEIESVEYPVSLYPYREEYPDGVPWVDRGAHFHVYGLNLGQWRFGFQESAVTFGESFSPEYFLSPMIMYFTQLVMDDGAKPWQEYYNSKHFMGFFLDKTTEDGYFTSQILIDDVNGDLLPGVENKNQNRLAWSIGGYRNFSFGRIGLFHAGATKDTFGSTYASTLDEDNYPNRDYDEYGADDIPVFYSYHPYPYTYYPAVQYELEDGTMMPIDYQQNNIGYKYGENNISFLVDFQKTFSPRSPTATSLYASLEWVLNGSKSPLNAWHEYDRWTHIPNPTQLLDGTVEQIVSLKTRVERPVSLFGSMFSVFSDLEVGMAFNAMGLEPAADDAVSTEAWIYRPQAGEHEALFSFTLGMGYLWRLK